MPRLGLITAIAAFILSSCPTFAQDYGPFQPATIGESGDGTITYSLRSDVNAQAHVALQLICRGANIEVVVMDSAYVDTARTGVVFLTYQIDQRTPVRTVLQSSPGSIRASFVNNQLAGDILGGLRSASRLTIIMGDNGNRHTINVENDHQTATEFDERCGGTTNEQQEALNNLGAAISPWSPLFFIDTTDRVNGRRLSLGAMQQFNGVLSSFGFACARDYYRFSVRDGKHRTGTTVPVGYRMDSDGENHEVAMTMHPTGLIYSEDRPVIDQILDGIQSSEFFTFSIRSEQNASTRVVRLEDPDGAINSFIEACRTTYRNY